MPPLHTSPIRLAFVLALVAGTGLSPLPPTAQSTFAARVAELSEPGGYFDTDNLISNERSYLHVVPALRDPQLRGGAYLGVGPDQNFSYIAHLRPSVALLVDIRRDNMLLHLLFKAMFAMSATRVEYLAVLTGRAPPEPVAAWADRSIEELVRYIDAAPSQPSDSRAAADRRLATLISGFGVPLTDADDQTIRRFHQRFREAGLSLKFNSAGRPPQWSYPTYRDLLLEVDAAGERRSFLASEEDFQFVRSLQARDLVIPVVGDLAGPQALGTIGRFLNSQRIAVSAFYASNVEFYLFRAGGFDRFVRNLGELPLRDGAVMVRSVFGGGARARRGYNSASLIQPVRELLEGHAEGRFRHYPEIIAASREVAAGTGSDRSF